MRAVSYISGDPQLFILRPSSLRYGQDKIPASPPAAPSTAMPYPSPYPPIDIPVVDLWKFLFENEKREFPDDKGKQAGFTAPPESSPQSNSQQLSTRMQTPCGHTPMPK